MPYKSQAQRGWAHTPAGMKALDGPAAVAEWDAASKGKKLPKKKKHPMDDDSSMDDYVKYRRGGGS